MSSNAQSVIRGLISVWTDFDSALERVPLIEKLNRGKLRLEDYRAFLRNHRQQVVEGSRWIARAASGLDDNYLELRSQFLRHAVTEHRDYRMLEDNYVACGGAREELLAAEKNIGTEALHAFMFHRASQPNPLDLLGAMFIIEGLGSRKASAWGASIKKQLGLEDRHVSFLTYHGEHDDGHLQEFEGTLNSGVLDQPGIGASIIKTSRIVARLYRLQLEELEF